MLFAVFSNIVMAQTSGFGAEQKALEKECKQFYKKLKAEGWTTWLPTEELSTAVERYYDKLASSDDDMVTLLGGGIGKTKSIAWRKAELHAMESWGQYLIHKYEV